MTTITDAKLTEAADAIETLDAFKATLIERFKLYAAMNLDMDVDARVKQGGGYITIQVPYFNRLFDDRWKTIDFYLADGEFGLGKAYAVPREFFFTVTDKEKEFLQYTKLKDKFAPAAK